MRGAAYGKLDKYTDAISDFIKAVDINPKYAEAYYNRGLVYSELDQNNQAITYFTKTIEINSKYMPAYLNRGAYILIPADMPKPDPTSQKSYNSIQDMPRRITIAELSMQI